MLFDLNYFPITGIFLVCISAYLVIRNSSRIKDSMILFCLSHVQFHDKISLLWYSYQQYLIILSCTVFKLRIGYFSTKEQTTSPRSRTVLTSKLDSQQLSTSRSYNNN
ncbi:MAG: hypothetical protein GPJ15_02360 [Microcystis aeruginosa G11-06]|nr:hypothetical protein [Microcystis aeruginosa G11-06]